MRLDIFKNETELSEENCDNDLMWWDLYLNNYKSRLDSINKSGLVWLVGPFWCWKTTFINKLKEKYDKNSIRINFEAWKYPERKDLWENFILDMAENLTEHDKDSIQKSLKSEASWVFEAIFKDWVDYITQYVPNLRNYLFKRNERELHIIEKILKEMLIAIHTRNCDTWWIISSIYIVIEDIDRSGDAWTYFLETLNYFLKNNEIWEWCKTIAIATIGSKEFLEHKESYLKCIDYLHDFPIKKFKYSDVLLHFIDKEYINYSTEEFFNIIWEKFQDQFTTRILKHIIRDTKLIIESWNIILKPEYTNYYLALILGVITSKYLYFEKDWKRISYFNLWKDTWWEIIEWDIFKSFFLSIVYRSSFTVNNEYWITELLPLQVNWYSQLKFLFIQSWSIEYLYSKRDNRQDKSICEIILNDFLLSI